MAASDLDPTNYNDPDPSDIAPFDAVPVRLLNDGLATTIVVSKSSDLVVPV